MGSKEIQGKLWGQRPDDWAAIQEKTGITGYDYVLNMINLKPSDKVLDVGCGSGFFSSMAQEYEADITGIDASEPLIERAIQRAPSVKFLNGEMESLPFDDHTFDYVCGFNSFQYAASVKNALTEANRVLKPGGILTAMIWGNKEDCEAASYLKAVGSLLPPPPPGAGGPFALSENNLLETFVKDCGFTIIHQADIDCVWDYENEDIALKGLISAGPIAKAIDNSGFDLVYNAVSEAIKPYIRIDGSVCYKNKYRIVTAKKNQ